MLAHYRGRARLADIALDGVQGTRDVTIGRDGTIYVVDEQRDLLAWIGARAGARGAMTIGAGPLRLARTERALWILSLLAHEIARLPSREDGARNLGAEKTHGKIRLIEGERQDIDDERDNDFQVAGGKGDGGSVAAGRGVVGNVDGDPELPGQIFDEFEPGSSNGAKRVWTDAVGDDHGEPPYQTMTLGGIDSAPLWRSTSDLFSPPDSIRKRALPVV